MFNLSASGKHSKKQLLEYNQIHKDVKFNNCKLIFNGHTHTNKTILKGIVKDYLV